MGVSRADLKRSLLSKRDRCDWCGHWLHDNADMHEWLIKRSTLPKDKRIFDERNCALLHHHCHMEHGQSTAMRLHLAKVFVKHYGEDEMIAFVDSLALKSPHKFINIIRSASD